MKTMLSHQPGGPETLTLETVPDPVPGAGEVLIRVRACAINYPDALIIEDKYQYRPQRPFAPGAEVAGEIAAIGPDVTNVAPGDRVIAMVSWGGLAEYAITPARRCIRMADAMPYDEGAAFILTYGTSYHALKQRARIVPGERLLVLGAAGGVGLAAVELGRAMGAEVIAAASSEEKVALAVERGASSGLVYPTDTTDAARLSAHFKDLLGGPVDVIYDSVGGAYAEAALRSIAWRGRYLVVGFPAGIPRIPLNLTLLKGCEIVGVFYGSFTEREPAINDANNAELMALYAEGKIRPYVSARYPLEDAGKAIADLAARRATGKLVVIP